MSLFILVKQVFKVQKKNVMCLALSFQAKFSARHLLFRYTVRCINLKELSDIAWGKFCGFSVLVTNINHTKLFKKQKRIIKRQVELN